VGGTFGIGGNNPLGGANSDLLGGGGSGTPKDQNLRSFATTPLGP
jgi:hypothetical protein